MEHSMNFGVVGLLFRRPDGKVTGPLGPFTFAKEMAEEMGFRFNRLARVVFEEETVLQQPDDVGHTGFDILIIGAKYDTGNLFLSLWIDMGIGGLPAAMCFADDREFLLSPVYEQTEFIQKPDKATITKYSTPFLITLP